MSDEEKVDLVREMNSLFVTVARKYLPNPDETQVEGSLGEQLKRWGKVVTIVYNNKLRPLMEKEDEKLCKTFHKVFYTKHRAGTAAKRAGWENVYFKEEEK